MSDRAARLREAVGEVMDGEWFHVVDVEWDEHERDRWEWIRVEVEGLTFRQLDALARRFATSRIDVTTVRGSDTVLGVLVERAI